MPARPAQPGREPRRWCVCVCVRARARARVRACVRACVRVCVHACNNTLPVTLAAASRLGCTRHCAVRNLRPLTTPVSIAPRPVLLPPSPQKAWHVCVRACVRVHVRLCVCFPPYPTHLRSPVRLVAPLSTIAAAAMLRADSVPCCGPSRQRPTPCIHCTSTGVGCGARFVLFIACMRAVCVCGWQRELAAVSAAPAAKLRGQRRARLLAPLPRTVLHLVDVSSVLWAKTRACQGLCGGCCAVVWSRTACTKRGSSAIVLGGWSVFAGHAARMHMAAAPTPSWVAGPAAVSSCSLVRSIGAIGNTVCCVRASSSVRRVLATCAPRPPPPPIQVTRGTPKLSSYSRFRLLPRCSPIKVSACPLCNLALPVLECACPCDGATNTLCRTAGHSTVTHLATSQTLAWRL
jgi:hypothetical protein